MSAHVDAAFVAISLITMLDDARKVGNGETVRMLEEVIRVLASTEMADAAVAEMQEWGPHGWKERLQRFHTMQVTVTPCTNRNCRFCDEREVSA